MDSNEEDILCLFHAERPHAGCPLSSVEKLKDGNFVGLLSSEFCDELFKDLRLGRDYVESLERALYRCVDCFLDSLGTNVAKKLDVLVVGVASLMSFVQMNWTGPMVEFGLPWLGTIQRDEVMMDLAIDGECCCSIVCQPELLVIARATLRACSNWVTELESPVWWWMRALFVHQQLLDEFSPTIHSTIMDVLEEAAFSTLRDAVSPDTRAMLHLEAARIHLYYSQVLRSKEQFTCALDIVGMKMELVGALGRRTHFQQRDIAQLTLKVDVDADVATNTHYKSSGQQGLPKDLRLDDEVRLDSIQFVSEDDTNNPCLTPIQQAVVLGMFVQTQKSQPQDAMLGEELMPYLQRVLSFPHWWSLQMSALFLRCRLEFENSRTVERSRRQLEGLVESARQQEPAVLHRLWGLPYSYLPPCWHLEAELAHLLVSLGLVRTALDIYKRLEMWEEVISCYNLMQQNHKAAEVIHQELKKKRTVKLLCLLGDATNNPVQYEIAWELSGHNSGRVQRHWAMYYYSRRQYAASIPHFRSSLACNSLQLPLWFRMGYAALETENWPVCARAYNRYCSLDPENFEAWNNLGKAYIKMGQKPRAWKALQEAVKCNYENWQVWDNLMVVSVDCGEFEEVLRAYHRILDLKKKHVDTEVLTVLVTAIQQDTLDSQGVPAGRLSRRALEFFGRLTGQVTDNCTLWRLYAELTASCPEPTEQSLQKVAQYLQRAHRCAVQTALWEKQMDSCKDVLKLCSCLADAYLRCCDSSADKEHTRQMLSSAKLSLKGVVTKVKQEHTDLGTGALPEGLQGLVEELEHKLSDIACRWEQ